MAAETHHLVTPTASGVAPAALDRPGLRTLRSARFRTLLAASLWLAGSVVLGAVLLRQAVTPGGQYAFDFQVYHAAAVDMAAGRSPYAAEMFAGPIPAQGALLYKYPPLLAQLLVPMAGLPLGVAAGIWFLAQAVAVFGATWLAALAGGAKRSPETFAWSAAATAFFLPVFDTLWKGNVSGFLALAVALALVGGAAGGLGAAAATLLKTTPVVMLAPALFAGRRVVLGLLAAVPVVVSAFALAPTAWLDFARVLPNLLSGPSLFANNMAPHSLVAFALPAVPPAADLMRILTVSAGAGAVAASVFLARRQDGWPAAVTLAVAASLLLPSATWFHYLSVLLPLGAFAWSRATGRERMMLTAGAGAVSAGLAWFPLVIVGATVMTTGVFTAVWPSRSRHVGGTV